ncbi:MAG: hypothetical protein HOC33_05030 [Alphaproteobacteria bacterium]|jgi:hypothetical protein|nr:hypothetical protein [Alphaproteobacteria bacterium]MBT4543191.1 hypothetical protein [Alphaproteobacteria bacterium]
MRTSIIAIFTTLIMLPTQAYAVCETPIDFSGKWELTEKQFISEYAYSISIIGEGNKIQISRVKKNDYDFESAKITYEDSITSDRSLKVHGQHPDRGMFTLSVKFDDNISTLQGSIKYQNELQDIDVSGTLLDSSMKSRQETRVECLERSIVEANKQRDDAVRRSNELEIKLNRDMSQLLEQTESKTTLLKNQLDSNSKKMNQLLSAERDRLEQLLSSEKRASQKKIDRERAKADNLKSNSEILSVNIRELTSLTERTAEEVARLRVMLRTSNKNLEVARNKPPKIYSTPLPKDYVANRKNSIFSKPDKKSKKLVTINRNAILANIAELPSQGWALVATENGIVGYVPSDILQQRKGALTISITEPEEETAEQPGQGIIIDTPSWDKGQENKVITLPSVGFVSLLGRVSNKIGIKSVTVNKVPADLFGSNKFGASLSIEKPNNKIKIVAVDNRGKVYTRDFLIVVTLP